MTITKVNDTYKVEFPTWQGTKRFSKVYSGFKTVDGKILIAPDFYSENDLNTIRRQLLVDGYEVVEQIASSTNWEVVERA